MDGEKGDAGYPGLEGLPGLQGKNGTDGYNGRDGRKGEPADFFSNRGASVGDRGYDGRRYFSKKKMPKFFLRYNCLK